MRMQTVQGVVSCSVPEFKPAEYKGLKSGIGKERRSSKHFGCKDKCCAVDYRGKEVKQHA